MQGTPEAEESEPRQSLQLTALALGRELPGDASEALVTVHATDGALVLSLTSGGELTLRDLWEAITEQVGSNVEWKLLRNEEYVLEAVVDHFGDLEMEECEAATHQGMDMVLGGESFVLVFQSRAVRLADDYCSDIEAALRLPHGRHTMEEGAEVFDWPPVVEIWSRCLSRREVREEPKWASKQERVQFLQELPKQLLALGKCDDVSSDMWVSDIDWTRYKGCVKHWTTGVGQRVRAKERPCGLLVTLSKGATITQVDGLHSRGLLSFEFRRCQREAHVALNVYFGAYPTQCLLRSWEGAPQAFS
eukprot:TRINITY_DN61311_c0_g1_i1.p1 TRINITY_DN61311_c0_g1~~TRINITY_DN61311_c0_g1_i1.p1  ORF type:complete len:321 (+),score=20.35 TRINITY_DN61311_c0_g1_i1:49-963(+)